MGIKVTMDSGATYTAQHTDTLRPWNAVPVDVYTVQDSNGAMVGTVHREVQGDGTALWTYDGGEAGALWRAVRAMVGGVVASVETADDAPATLRATLAENGRAVHVRWSGIGAMPSSQAFTGAARAASGGHPVKFRHTAWDTHGPAGTFVYSRRVR